MMEVLTGAADVFATGGVSAIFGGLFGFLTKWQKNKHDREMLRIQLEDRKDERRHEASILDKELQSAENIAGINAEAEMAVAESAAIQGAHESDKATYSDGLEGGRVENFLMFLIDFYRGFIRPTITLYGVIFLTWIWRELAPMLADLTQDQKYALFLIVLNAIIFLVMKAVGYWFGSRGKVPTFKEIATLGKV